MNNKMSMRVKCLFFILLFHVGNHPSFANGYLEYYELVNQAEIKIVQSSYSEALQLYELAFNKVDYSLARDCFNAATCAYLLNDYEKTLGYIRQCALKGIDLSAFETCFFQGIHHLQQWRSLSASKENLKDKHFQSIDLILRRRVDLLHAMDQKVRFDNPKRDKEAQEKIYKVDKQNFLQLLEIIDEYGVPGERLIGLDNFRSPIFYLLWHNNRDISSETMDALKNAVLAGKFDRYDYSRIVTLKETKNIFFGSRAFFRIDNVLYAESYGSEMISKIDKNRKEIGLESFRELKTKVLYSITDNPFNLRTGGITKMSFLNETEKDRFIKNLILVE